MDGEKKERQRTKLDKLADGLSYGMIIACILIFCVMVYSVSYGVLGRYLPFIRNPRWTQELAVLCMVWLCFLGAGYGIKEGLHVRMTVIECILPKKAAAFLHRGAYGLLFLVNVTWIIYGAQILSLSQRAKMSATGWPMSITYLSVVTGGIYGAAMAAYRIVKGGF